MDENESITKHGPLHCTANTFEGKRTKYTYNTWITGQRLQSKAIKQLIAVNFCRVLVKVRLLNKTLGTLLEN